MEIDVTTITSPVQIDDLWDQLSDSKKFSLWVVASGLHFNTYVPKSIQDSTIESYKEVLSR